MKKKQSNEEQVGVAVTHVVVFDKKKALYGDCTTEVKLVHDGTDSWVKILQEGNGFIEINFDEWPALQAAVELIIKMQPPKF